MGKRVAIIGDTSDHGGTITNSNQDGTVKYAGIDICVEGCQHDCPIIGHGTTDVLAITTKSYINGKLIITEDAVAGCGAKIIASSGTLEIE